MGYTARLTAPERGNLYYNKKHTATYTAGLDGYNPCILGNYPFNVSSDKRTGYPGLTVLPNCSGWVVSRFNEIGGYGYCKWLGNAYGYYMITLAKLQGLQIGTTPKLGAVLCFSGGNGHVAVVEKVISATEIVTSESGWNTQKIFWTQTRHKGTGNWGQSSSYKFQGFVYHPDVVFELCPYSQPTKAIKKGARGTAVKWMQWHLNWHGYDLVVDGSLGTLSDRALRDFQRNNGLVVDGWCGVLTRAKLIATLPWNA